MDKNIQDKIRGSLIGGAIGDALGYPVEFMSYAGIVHKYGDKGITRYELDRKSGKALVSDDTQMTLFTANGLLFGVTRWCTHGVLGADLPDYVSEAYKDWYETQTFVRDYNAYHTCWIRDIKELNARRAPGNTCMSAMESIMNGKEAVNDSKGCGGVMRVAPVGCFMASPQVRHNHWAEHTVDRYAAECAAITHKHPLGYIPAAVLANIVYRILVADEPVSKGELIQIVESAMMDARDCFTKDNEVKAWAELCALMNNAIRFAQSDVKDIDAVSQLGEGWTGDEALAIAVYCALKHTDNFEDAIIAAVNHSGDSDSTGAVCGNIMGAIVGYEAIPEFFKEDLELRQVILALADDMVHGCNISEYHLANTMDEKQWERRYIFANPMLIQMNKRYTPERITSLAENEVFVFGSNLAGSHGGGAARMAYAHFGAIWGHGVGLQGQSYAIPTMQGGVETIRPYVDEFIHFARQNSHLTFLVTRIGCGIAGFSDDEIAPLFKDALGIDNVILPKEFVECLEERQTV